jgi:hypothetical protein
MRRLAFTNKGMQEIALGCGFESVRTFNRAFSEETGISPSEYRRALRKVQEVEETMVQGEVEALNRRLSAANAEIRRYQTRLFACEREMVALRQENAELEALCDQARKNELLPQKRPQPPVLDQPGLPVIVFPGQEKPEAEAPAPEETRPEPPAAPQEEEQPSPFEQKDWKPTTALDQLSVDIVHQLEALMG